jgi:hypothetical protein
MAMLLVAGVADRAHAQATGTTVWSPKQWNSTQNALWLDASNGGSLLNRSGRAVANGQAIATWNDLSGNNQNLTQTDSTLRPIFAANAGSGTNAFGQTLSAANFTRSMMTGTGANTSYWKFMSDGSSQYTIFAVVKTGTSLNPLVDDGTNAAYGIVGTGLGATSGTGMHLLYDDRSGRLDRLTVQIADGASPVVLGNSQDNFWKPNQYQMVDFQFNVTSPTSTPSFASYQSGSLTGTVGVRGDTPNTGNPSNFLQLGSIGSGTAAYLKGGFQEFIIYKGAISGSDRQLAEGYLAWKWGLQSQLSATSPYSPNNTNGYMVVVPEPVPVAMLTVCGLAGLGVVNHCRRRSRQRRSQGVLPL